MSIPLPGQGGGICTEAGYQGKKSMALVQALYRTTSILPKNTHVGHNAEEFLIRSTSLATITGAKWGPMTNSSCKVS